MVVARDIPGLGDRQMDMSEPLLQIAQLAGDEWPQKLIDALKRTFNSGPDDDSIGADLLGTLRPSSKKATRTTWCPLILLERLCNIEGRPWAEWLRGRGLTPNGLARLLKPFRVHPTKIRFSTSAYSGVFQGYRRADFEDAWLRYCPHPPFKSEQLKQPAPLLAETAFSELEHTYLCSGCEKCLGPAWTKGCSGCSSSKPGDRCFEVEIMKLRSLTLKHNKGRLMRLLPHHPAFVLSIGALPHIHVTAFTRALMTLSSAGER